MGGEGGGVPSTSKKSSFLKMSQYTLLPEKNYQISGFFSSLWKNVFLEMSQYAFLPEKNPNLRVGFFPVKPRLLFFPTTLKPSPCSIAGAQSPCVQVTGHLQKQQPFLYGADQNNRSSYCRPQDATKMEVKWEVMTTKNPRDRSVRHQPRYEPFRGPLPVSCILPNC